MTTPPAGDAGGVPGVTSPDAGAAVPYLIVALVAAAIVSFLLTPASAGSRSATTRSTTRMQRRVNTSPVPRGGGVAVAIAFVVVTVALLALNAVERVRRRCRRTSS